jgi:hypothetical protein
MELRTTALVLLLALSGLGARCEGSQHADVEAGAAVGPVPIIERGTSEDCTDVTELEQCKPHCCPTSKFEGRWREVAVECRQAGGEQLAVYEDGCVAACELRDGRRHGPRVMWASDGELRQHSSSVEGESQGSTWIYGSDGLVTERVWDHNELVCERYWRDGKLEADGCEDEEP